MSKYDGKYWLNQIKLSKKFMEKFHENGRKINSKYLCTGDADTPSEAALTGVAAMKYNMFWANVAILKSALYGNPPKPTAAREFMDPEDDIARVAASMMERLLKVGPDGDGSDMHVAFEHAVEDRLIPGMGQLWLRYDASTEMKSVLGIPLKRIKNENVMVDYVHWLDFYYSPCRVWEEREWVGRRVWMSKDKMLARFKNKALVEKIPLVVPKDGIGMEKADGEGEGDNTILRGEVFEIWCLLTRKVYWVAVGLDQLLDEADDPLKLPKFFPCPKPLVSTTTTGKFIARADYTMVQDQYEQLNTLNIRIGYLIEACKAIGVYDQTAEGIKKIFTTGVENQLIPVDNWAMFAEKGGIKGVIDWVPIDAIAAVIEKLRETRADCIAQIYELTGLSDIMRGISNPRETYGAQQLKAQYSSSRLQLYQLQVGQFVSEAMNIKAMIISKHWDKQTIIRKSLVMYTPDREYAEQAADLIKDAWELMFRINISSTQMSIPDYNAEKQARQEYVTSMGQFMSQVASIMQMAPEAGPFFLRILQWAGASFQNTGGVETIFDNFVRAVEKRLAQPPQPPQPSPDKVLDNQTKTQLADLEAKRDVQLAQIKAGLEERMAAADRASKERIEQMKITAQREGDNAENLRSIEALAQQEEQARKEHMSEVNRLVEDSVAEIDRLIKDHENKVKILVTQAAAKNKEGEGGGKIAGKDAKEAGALGRQIRQLGETLKSTIQSLRG